MDSSIEYAARSSLTSRVVQVLFAAVMLSALMAATGAFADPGHDRQEHGRDDHGRGHDSRRGHSRPPEIRYAQPVYVPAPEYYEPQQSPGISLFLPFDLRR